MQLNVPMKVLAGALWDPNVEPFGAKSVITVRDMNEVQPFTLPDVTGTAIERIQMAERASERLAGITDAAAGTTEASETPLPSMTIRQICSSISNAYLASPLPM